MRTIWLTSDPHYNHVKVIPYCKRPFSCVEEMNEALVLNFNAKVQPDDLTYHLGDFSLQEAMVPKYLSQLSGEHILIPGNHDLCHPANRRRKKKTDSIEAATQRYLDFGFKEIHLSLELDELLLTHMPWRGDSIDTRQKYEKYRPEYQPGKTLLHGHIHNKRKYDAERTQLNVGVDVWNFAPISLDEVRAFLATNPATC
jgi:calcineurin-like phosphoesterase family protein